MNRRVAITGTGAVSAAGRGVDAFWKACLEGRSALRSATAIDTTGMDVPAVGEVPSALDPHPERATAFALAAAGEALERAGLVSVRLPAAGVAIGTCQGGADATLDWLRGVDTADVEPAPEHGTFAAPARAVAHRFGCGGPVITCSVACASGTAAIGHAAESIAHGEADLMLAGGTEALSRFIVSGFWLLRALSPDRVRPFDGRRNGLALGEGAGMLVLEEREHARRRGAPILAELVGHGSAGDANHMTGPSPEGDGVVRALRAALQRAGSAPGAVDFVSAHGTGTPYNDRMETIAFKRVFGRQAHAIPINSVKPIVGHTLGAAGALEAVLCVRVISESLVPPTINYGEPDPECDLDYVTAGARARTVRRAVSTSSAFAGTNAAIVLDGP